MMAGGIEETRQHNQHCGHEIHQTPSVQAMLRYDDAADFASIGSFWQREYVVPRGTASDHLSMQSADRTADPGTLQNSAAAGIEA